LRTSNHTSGFVLSQTVTLGFDRLPEKKMKSFSSKFVLRVGRIRPQRAARWTTLEDSHWQSGTRGLNVKRRCSPNDARETLAVTIVVQRKRASLEGETLGRRCGRFFGVSLQVFLVNRLAIA
jgi:hypothetical protein